MEIVIREAVIADADALARLSNQLGYAITIAGTFQNLESILPDQNQTVLVAFHDGKVVGWIHVFLATRVESTPFCEIGGLVVDDQYRRMGIGKLLIERIKPWCSNKGGRIIRVRSNVKRIEAHEFYSQLGFVENKQQKIFQMILSDDA
jgi:GNAT superfamily N-acetyltransferase